MLSGAQSSTREIKASEERLLAECAVQRIVEREGEGEGEGEGDRRERKRDRRERERETEEKAREKRLLAAQGGG